jgi:Ca-activated chloride channel family protein
MRLKWLVSVCLASIVVMLSNPVLARTEEPEDKTLSPYFFVENGDPEVDSLPLKDTKVAVDINGVIAGVKVTQIYANEGKRPINARYVFPASTKASIHGMTMTVGERVVKAQIKEKGEAKKEFVQAKAEGKSASLLEEQRPNVFTMNLANIIPGDVVRIELYYSELLVPVEGTYEFVYPTVVGPRYSSQKESEAAESDKWVKSPYFHQGEKYPGKFAIDLTMSTGIPVQEATSPSHDIDLQWREKSLLVASLAKPEEFCGDRDFILRYRLAGREIQSGLLLYRGEEENFFLLMTQPPQRVETAEILPREYIFVIDVSGSMHGFPLDTAKTLIRDLIGHLRPDDKFNLVFFAGSSSVMAPSSLPATPENIQKAIRLIDSHSGSGGTELAAGLKRALSLPRDEGRARTALIITDGYIAAEKEAFGLIAENLNNTNVFSFGIGSSVNRYLIEGLARTGQGESFVVTHGREAPGTAARFSEYVRSPLLSDVRVDFKGFDAYDVEPPALPDLFASRPLVLFGKWRGEASGGIEISGRTAAGDYTRKFAVADSNPLAHHEPLKYLWARSRIARLNDFNIGGNERDIKGEVTNLGLKYNLLTPYTSFIAVVEEVRNHHGIAEDVDQPLPMPAGVSDLAVGGYASVPEPGLTGLLVSTSVVLLGAACLRRRRNRSR